ncbi:hypothetical protein JKA74_15160 [Marivirga sp. S37H4]|uniref:DUF6443 domain-containing protein n=1 Tax=Marivirga aurantiaca TaxID=2802615 RepID=A0A935CAT2_9BACT|nr:DUF6443 domain-containing protein [Marivirga aurantiaca]MBK6266382.1 hypothetical protein [Marivirga aurantiaca]
MKNIIVFFIYTLLSATNLAAQLTSSPVVDMTSDCSSAQISTSIPSTDNSYYWQTSSGGTDLSHPGNELFTVFQEGDYYLRKKEKFSWTTTNYLSVQFKENNDAGEISGSTSYCSEVTGQLVITNVESPIINETNATLNWEKSLTSNGPWYLISGENDINLSVTADLDDKTYYRRKIVGSNCGNSYSNVVSITPVSVSNPGVESTYNVCYGSNLVINPTGSLGNNEEYRLYQNEEDIIAVDAGATLTLSNVEQNRDYWIARVNTSFTVNCTSDRVKVSIVVSNPPTSTVVTIDPACGSSDISWQNPAGYTWYWQGQNQAGKISTSASKDFSVTSSGTYYIRAKSNEVANCWGPPRSIFVAVSKPLIPVAPSMSQECDKTILTRGSSPEGYTLYWQGTNSNGTVINTVNASETYEVTEGGIYYLRAKSNNVPGCWGPSRSISVADPVSVSNPGVESIYNVCYGSNLVINPSGSLGNNEEYRLYQNEEDVIAVDAGATLTLSNVKLNNEYWIAKVNTSFTVNCTSDRVKVNIVVSNPPTSTVVTIDPACGSSDISWQNPSGYTWYWQGQNQAGKISTSASNEFSVTSDGTYYIRAKSNTVANCWGPSLSIPVVVADPTIPAIPTVNQQCDKTILTRGSYPEGYALYWQGTDSNGTVINTVNASETYEVTEGGTYYLRAKSNNVPGCWGPSRSISVADPVSVSNPGVESIYNVCYGSNLVINPSGSLGNNEEYRLYQNEEDVIAVDAGATLTLSNVKLNNEYWIAKVNTSFTVNCTSDRVKVNIVVSNPPTSTVVTIDPACGSSDISWQNPAGYTWYWQGQNEDGENSTSASDEFSVTSSGTYYIRAKNNDVANCWGPPHSISVEVADPTIPAIPTVNQQCDKTILTRGSSPEGYTLYWQGTDSNGTVINTVNASETYEVTEGGTYYLRAKSNEVPDCWGPFRSISVTVNTSPEVTSGSTISLFSFEGNRALNGTGESPTGGTFSGSYVSNNTFNASQSGAGNHTVTYTYTTEEECSASATKTITVKANPIMTVDGSEDIVWGEERELTVPTGFAAYQWYKDGAAINGATNNAYTVEAVGQYYVKITAASGASLDLSPTNFINLASKQNRNFIQKIRYKVPRKEFQAVKSIGEISEEFVYIDGIGRTEQIVLTQSSPLKNDIIKAFEYAGVNPIEKEFLPYTANKKDGVLDPVALRDANGSYEASSQYNFYANGSEGNRASTTYPYLEIDYEPSPLNRPVAQYAPGEEWSKEGINGGKAVTTDYLVNSQQDVVLKFKMEEDDLQVDGSFPAAVFEKTLTTDENGNQSATFTDAFGRVLLIRNYGDNGEQFDTYYVYDQLNKLRFVIPPEAVNQLLVIIGAFPLDLLDQFVFQYKYDVRNRMIWKKVPGAEPVIMIYDGRGRLVLSQDGKQKNDNLFSFTKYDALNRPVMTGEKEITNSAANIRNLLSGSDWLQNYAAYETLEGNHYGYTNNSYPSVNEADIYTVTYYDDYDFRTDAGMDAAIYNYAANGVTNEFPPTNHVKGLATGSLTRVLETAEMLGSINYYDERYRMVQNISEQLGGKTITTTNGYDFAGNLLQTKSEYNLVNERYHLNEVFEYDHADRLMKGYHELSKSVDWQNVIGYNVDTNNNLIHTAANHYNYTSAHTKAIIPIESDGYFEVRPEMNARMLFGFNDEPEGTGYTDMEFCIYTTTSGYIHAYESGASKKNMGTYTIGDVLRVAKINGQIHYQKNGETLYLSTKSVDKPLYGDVTSFYDGNTISHAVFSTAGRQLMVSNEYNELGELVTKNLHAETSPFGGTQGGFAQSVDYRYNIRGWLERINHADLSADNTNEAPDLFGMELGYTDNLGLSSTAQYNGNISAIKWGGKRNDITQTETIQQNAYGYAYDPLNRIKEANYFEGAAQSPSQKYQLRINQYDMNGNIKLLQRRDATGALMDDLTYNYANNGNRLNHVTDAGNVEEGFKDGNTAGNDYTYDDNGNMMTDANKEITSITYNHLNLPQEVNFVNGNQIRYIYDASGIKQRQEVFEGNTLIKATDYIGSLILENETLQFIQTMEGRVVPKNVDGQEKMEYQYHMSDHLGNVRTTFAVRDEDYSTDFETAENPYFDNYDQISRLATNMKKSGSYSHRLAGGSNETVGLMKTMYVSKGDKVSAEVYGKYLAVANQDDAINTGALITALVNMLSGGAVTGEGNLVSDNLTSGFTSAAIADDSNEQSPRAYLNYIMLDKDFNFVNSGFERLSTSAADPGDGSGTHQKLSFEEILIDQDGYLMVFLSNESQQPVEVFWDDFRVDHHHTAVIQASDYFPFGLPFNEYKRAFSKENTMNTFQDQEVIKDFGLNWVQFKWRNDMPELGRFFNVDPLAEDYYYNSPYAFSENKVTVHIELEGLEAVYVFDQPERPQDNGTAGTTYTGEIYVVGNDGKVNGPYSGSSYPNSVSLTDNSAKFNTLSEGEHSYNNKSGHKGSSQKGLNIDDSSTGDRTTTGTSTDGSEVEMKYVNAHSGTSDKGGPASRGSKGCITCKPSENESFMSNFDWSGSVTVGSGENAKTYTGTTGTSSGKFNVYRGGATADQAKKNLVTKQVRDNLKLPAAISGEVSGSPLPFPIY